MLRFLSTGSLFLSFMYCFCGSLILCAFFCRVPALSVLPVNPALQGRVDAFQEILHESADESLEDVYRDSTAERVAILDALAAYYTGNQ